MSEPAVTVAKRALRDQLLAARRSLDVASLGVAGRSLAEVVLATPEVRRAATVAAYVSVGSEPGTGALLAGLHEAGKRVILPVLLPDNDLDWAVWAPAEAGQSSAARAGRSPSDNSASGLRSAGRGLLEPTGPRLGVDAIATADVVLVPGLAVGADGLRMGRGGGSYDRTLNRVAPDAFVCVLLHDGEVLARVPAEPHDVPVHAAATPSGMTRFR
ncbi:5-formyltetrahydrofolate cyclo-ligase [Nocardioides jejuensis]|uniref:5-formyltetrahydrofolate cyclo-ligase n=1 Tax=Nocardioides jejuensis TaxID=2502782 RepID=A0A4R1CK51_9ACTN|nr:5-formyltetrahydrofolate cyclo-ligase [Nocardioides jejuensis]TCJ30378.1 5-formyltetrahydrofolate cyclo-ligase [Nocardioides jejuensis]